jgi:hypothetical protein
MPEAQVRRRIFEQQRSAQRRLRDVDVAAHDGERLLRQRERQQIAEMNAVHCAPRQVLRHKPGLDACDQIGDASKMPRVETIGAAERHPDPVQADRVARADRVQNAGCDSTAICGALLMSIALSAAGTGPACAASTMPMAVESADTAFR